jgi:AraC-like DNA-binding protein/mannose-6-phosphate isomerase-like protein (cupin superfamily)
MKIMKDFALYAHQNIENTAIPVEVSPKSLTEPGPLFDYHWHELMQFFYFQEGQADIYCNGHRISTRAGDLVVINSNELHYGENQGNRLSYFIIKFDYAFLFSDHWDTCQYKYLNPLAQNKMVFKNLIRNDRDVLHHIKNIIDEMQVQSVGYELAVKANLFGLLTILIRKYAEKVYDKRQYEEHRQKITRYQGILDYIDQNYKERIDLAHLAEMANVTPSHFCRVFKTLTGKTFVEYLNQLRINKALSLLKESDYTITEVAMESGFDDINYFCRIFKKYKHCTPREIRVRDSLS